MTNVRGIQPAHIDSLGAIQIEAMDAEGLASWYTNVFGVIISHEHEGSYYGDFQHGGGRIHISIVPTTSPFQFSKSIALTFHVSEFSSYLKKLKKAGVEITSDFETEQGKFAYFADPEGNRLGIWGS